MKIAFDAKRAFHNRRGLGNYSRNTIRILSEYFPENEYFLFNPVPKKNINFTINRENTTIIYPESIFYKIFPSLWRSCGCLANINSVDADIFHGLSQELPTGIHRTKTKTVVSVHDTIFMRFPEQYDKVYRNFFIKKNRYIAERADKIIAISEATKEDFINYFNAEPENIDVVYQGCNNLYREKISDEKRLQVKVKYDLPADYILTVGAIEARKNIETILRAIKARNISLPFVVVGHESKYLKVIKNLISELAMEKQVIFLHDVPIEDLPSIYKMALVFVYPSMFEGFGIPILEALCVGVPVITSKDGVFNETGGKACLYVNYNNVEEMSGAMELVLQNEDLRMSMIRDGFEHAAAFTDKNISENLARIYDSILERK